MGRRRCIAARVHAAAELLGLEVVVIVLLLHLLVSRCVVAALTSHAVAEVEARARWLGAEVEVLAERRKIQDVLGDVASALAAR